MRSVNGGPPAGARGAAVRLAARPALPPRFYARHPAVVARALLGKVLLRRTGGRVLAGRIVEAEAYTGEDDPASHAFRGRTPRNDPMYGPPGRAYVYFTYGNHFMLNAVTGRDGRASAVLLRALDPLCGIPAMCRRRGIARAASTGRAVLRRRISGGPGRLTEALGITRSFNRRPLDSGALVVVSDGFRLAPGAVARGARIGIRRGLSRRWRFFVSGHPAVSRG